MAQKRKSCLAHLGSWVYSQQHKNKQASNKGIISLSTWLSNYGNKSFIWLSWPQITKAWLFYNWWVGWSVKWPEAKHGWLFCSWCSMLVRKEGSCDHEHFVLTVIVHQHLLQILAEPPGHPSSPGRQGQWQVAVGSDQLLCCHRLRNKDVTMVSFRRLTDFRGLEEHTLTGPAPNHFLCVSLETPLQESWQVQELRVLSLGSRDQKPWGQGSGSLSALYLWVRKHRKTLTFIWCIITSQLKSSAVLISKNSAKKNMTGGERIQILVWNMCVHPSLRVYCPPWL